MANLLCDEITDGLRSSERLSIFHDYSGRRHFLRVEADFLNEKEGRWYLPIGIVNVDPKSKLVLIELPQEAETGANRLWVKPEQLDEPIEVYA